LRIATADIGGTFTDLVLVGADGQLHIDKRLSTRRDYSEAVADGIAHLLEKTGGGPEGIEEVRHGTTVATNAILERRGARTALITTKGFRDVLEIGRLRTPRLYDINWSKPAPLVPRRHCFEVDERITADGGVLRPLDEAALIVLAGKLVESGIESVAICFINAYANVAHEVRAREILSEHCPQIDISISSEVLREMREFERTSTTVANAYVRPTMRRYLQLLVERLGEHRIRRGIYVMQSNGGLLGLEDTVRRPVYAIESGPAAGVIGARRLCQSIGMENAITLDMGGTTAKASIIENGRIEYSPEIEIGGEISRSSRLIKGSGYLIRTPAIDVAEVGAGGGSIAWLDSAAGLKVGPISAGSSPGPACYGLGGTEPTVTDANLVLGLLNPAGLAGGSVPLDLARAKAAIDGLGRALAMSEEQVATGIHEIATANMARAIRSVSTERGRDIRRFWLIAFGGSGPVFAAPLERMFSMPGVIVPPNPGVFSAMGLLYAEKEHHLVYTLPGASARLDAGLIAEQLPKFRKIALADIDQRDAGSGFETEWFADMRYVGQGHDLRVAIREGDGLAEVRRQFDDEHKLLYGHEFADMPVEVTNLRVVLRERNRAAAPREVLPLAGRRADATASSVRECFFGETFGRRATQIFASRQTLGGGTVRGPIIIEEYDATIVVPPDFEARLDDAGNIYLTSLVRE
jgi:N-methylhydantoinase A